MNNPYGELSNSVPPFHSQWRQRLFSPLYPFFVRKYGIENNGTTDSDKFFSSKKTLGAFDFVANGLVINVSRGITLVDFKEIGKAIMDSSARSIFQSH